MAAVEFISHKGRKIISIDFSHKPHKEIYSLIETAKKMIAGEPAGTVLTLTNVEGVDTNREMSDALKAFASHNKPYVKAGAVVGVSGLKQVTFNALLIFTGRKNLILKNSLEEAKNWLVDFPA